MRYLFLLLLMVGLAVGADNIIPDDSRAPITNSLPWARVGYRWQQDPPTVPVSKNLVTDYSADTNGIVPANTAIASAVAGVTRGQAIYFPPGKYLLTNELSYSSGESFVFRGAGPGLTTLYIQSHSNTLDGTIRFAGSGNTSTTLTADALRGATNISVTSTSGFTPGGFVVLRVGTNALTAATNSTMRGRLEHPTAQLQNQWNEIHSIGTGTVTVKKPLYASYYVSNSPTLFIRNLMTNVGVEEMTIVQVVPTIGNTNMARQGVYFFQCADFWTCNVVYTNAGEHAFVSDLSFRGTFRRSRPLYPARLYQSAYGISIRDASGDILAENNGAWRHSSGIVVQYSSGCVIGYNYCHASTIFNQNPSTDVGFGILFHGDAASFNLAEGNVVSRMDLDNFWGNNDYNYLLRNWIRGYQISEDGNPAANNRYGLTFAQTNYYNSSVGNFLGHPTTNGITAFLLGHNEESGSVAAGNDPMVTNTTFIAEQWNFVSKAMTSSNGYPTIPSSYYLATKPTWFSNIAWPVAFTQSDLITNNLAWIPAQAEFEGVDYSGITPGSAAIRGGAALRGGATLR